MCSASLDLASRELALAAPGGRSDGAPTCAIAARVITSTGQDLDVQRVALGRNRNGLRVKLGEQVRQRARAGRRIGRRIEVGMALITACTEGSRRSVRWWGGRGGAVGGSARSDAPAPRPGARRRDRVPGAAGEPADRADRAAVLGRLRAAGATSAARPADRVALRDVRGEDDGPVVHLRPACPEPVGHRELGRLGRAVARLRRRGGASGPQAARPPARSGSTPRRPTCCTWPSATCAPSSTRQRRHVSTCPAASRTASTRSSDSSPRTSTRRRTTSSSTRSRTGRLDRTPNRGRDGDRPPEDRRRPSSRRGRDAGCRVGRRSACRRSGRHAPAPAAARDSRVRWRARHRWGR